MSALAGARPLTTRPREPRDGNSGHPPVEQLVREMQATDAARGTIRSPAAVAKAARRAVRARTSVPVSYQPDRWAIRGADPTAITAVRNVAREGR